MSEEQGKESPSEMNLSQKQSVRSGSHVFSSVSVKSDWSKDIGPDFSEKKTSSTQRLQYDTLDSDFQTHKKNKNFTDDLLGIFQDLENKMIMFLKNELEKFKKILQKEDLQYFVKDFNENRCSVKEAALDLTLYFLREMKQDEAANTLEDELIFIHQLKSNLKKKYQCVFEGIAKQGDSTLLNNIYTDLYITQGCSEQVNTEHEVRQIEVASRRHESQEIQVECKNLFEAPEQDKHIRTVLTKGVAGIGKSVSVQKFVLDWAEGRENQDISFIFPLPFREMNLKEEVKLSLMDLITQFFPETKGLNLTRRNQFKVLFILDGLDECRLPVNFKDNETLHDVFSPVSLDVLLTNLIKGNLLPSALIWITTRPAAASKIPPDCIDRLTEIRGFNDAQKEEYFRKRITDENLAKEIIDHVKQSKSLFIMCHIPVFCWISATVLQNILEEKRNNDLKYNQADDVSKTLQESNTEDTPKTLTQMYTHFLRFQIQQSRQKYDGDYTPDVSWDKQTILSLGKLAFQQLEKNNVIFYESDLQACGIDIYKASVYSGMCTQIFMEEKGITVGTMYCFVHLSIQEFIAALYAHLFLITKKENIFIHESSGQENKNENVIDLLKTAVDKALKSDNGHLDLFLRFLLGLSLQSNRRLLRGLLMQEYDNDQSQKEIVQYIKQKFEADLSPERSINLFYCLNELNDQTLVKEIQTHLSKGSLSSADLSPAQWSALAFVLLTSEEEPEEFELQKFKKSDECLIRLLAVIKTSKRALLNDCGLTDKSCHALSAVLGSDTNLKELNMNNNNLQDSGVKLFCTGLKNTKCHLEILRLSNCSITEEGYTALSSALRSNPSHLIELDLTGNDPGQSGVKELSDLLQDPNCQLKTLRLSNCSITEEGYKALASALRSIPSHLIELDLTGNDPGQSGVKELNDLLQDPNCQLKTVRFVGPAADEACQYVTGIVGKNPLLLRELNLSEHELGDTRVNQISALLEDKHCQLNTLNLWRCSITEKQCLILTSALKSNPSHLRELDLSLNELGDSGVKNLSDLLMNPQFKLEKLNLCGCSITEKQCLILTSALKSNPSHLRELNLRWNELGDSGVKNLSDLLMNPQFKLEKLDLWRCSITEKQCFILTSALKSNPSHLRELNLSGNKLGDSGVKDLSDLLMNPQFKLEKLHLCYCRITEEQCLILTSALKSNPSHLRELDLSENQITNTGVNVLCDVLKDSNCKLERLRLRYCEMTDEGCSAVTSALKSNPSHLRELDLSRNKLGDSGVKNLSDLLMNPQFKLEKLDLCECSITEKQCLILTSALKSNPSHLRELNLSGNKLGDSGVKNLSDLLMNPQFKLEKLNLLYCRITEKQCLILTSALKSNPSHLRELNLTGNELGDSGVKNLSDLLMNPQFKLKKLDLCRCSITEEQCLILTSALKSNPSHLRELNLSWNKLGDSGVKNLSDLLMNPQFKLEKLHLWRCSITEEQCLILTSDLKSNPSHLRELNLSENQITNTGVNDLCDVLKDSHCKLERLRLSDCEMTDEGCSAVTSALKSNPSHLRELDLSGNKLGDSGVKNLSDLLMNPQFKLEKLHLSGCSITEKQCLILTSALKSNPSHLRELNLSWNKPGDSGVKNLSDLLMNPQFKLEKLDLRYCSITEKQCLILTSALKSNPSHLRELNLNRNQITNTGVNGICDVLKDSHCKLERLSLYNCGITDVSSLTQSLTNTKALQFLKELDLSDNMIGDSKQRLIDVLRDSNCKLSVAGDPLTRVPERLQSPKDDKYCMS
ncbi:NACHT, LRR and PYD domains-containing protein 12-like isoform X15 [Garra rufa]|uniref:NACHT, LRR and PYD domains-containing protein 12-like isoform X15 n=1 Tax=Garra rufa TaxID=137080 RepID=UPI003CCE781C